MAAIMTEARPIVQHVVTLQFGLPGFLPKLKCSSFVEPVPNTKMYDCLGLQYTYQTQY